MLIVQSFSHLTTELLFSHYHGFIVTLVIIIIIVIADWLRKLRLPTHLKAIVLVSEAFVLFLVLRFILKEGIGELG